MLIYITIGDVMSAETQLPLSLHLRDDAIFDNFVVGDNAQLIHHLKLLSAGNRLERYIYCYGPAGVGRSHLLQACCHAQSTQQKPVFYLPLCHVDELSPDILDGLEHFSLVCIDDVNAVMGKPSWEEALFHFFNRARDNHVGLLISANMSPKQLACRLPDLQTRLASGLVIEIQPLTDPAKKVALQMRAANRGMTMSDEVTHFLLRHYSRNMRDLFVVLDQLDHASLVAKRKLTIPFVKAVLNHSRSNDAADLK